MDLPITIDYETQGIESRPKYPPVPVGVAIDEPGRKAEYLSWGHPGENNCTKAQAAKRLKTIYRSGRPLLFHHAKFDLDVGETHMDLPMPPWHQYHDTMFLLFLDDPHAETFSLKPSAERILKLPPTERDAVRDWIIANVPDAKRAKANWGKWIAQAPGKLVGRYAVGDVVRTLKLFKVLYKRVLARGMGPAYDRERKLMPILLANERRGIPVRLRALEKDVGIYEGVHEAVGHRLVKKLGKKDLNLDSNTELVDALHGSKFVDDSAWLMTANNNISTSKDSIAAAVKDKELKSLLRYRGALSTVLGTFMKPWLDEAHRTGGVVHPSWNQVRQNYRDGKDFAGARTGRLSTSRFMNTPKEFMDEKTDEPIAPPKGFPPLPLARAYLGPGKCRVWLKRDYSQQELRLLGHFEDGVLLQAYLEDPWLDVHALARTLINQMLNANYGRKPIKNTGFGIIYGMGIEKLAWKSATDYETARRVRNAYMAIFPGLKTLIKTLKQLAKDGEPLRTWGGREYYCEPPRIIDGEERNLDYKLLNYLIQGSAADCTKESIIRYHEVPNLAGEFLITVHDEINIAAELANREKAMRQLRDAMESIELDVPLLSEGEWSLTDWAHLKDFDDKRKIMRKAA